MLEMVYVEVAADYLNFTVSLSDQGVVVGYLAVDLVLTKQVIYIPAFSTVVRCVCFSNAIEHAAQDLPCAPSRRPSWTRLSPV